MLWILALGCATQPVPPEPTPREALSCEGYDEADYDDVPARFFPEDAGVVVLAGYIEGRTPRRFRRLLSDHPDTHTLVLPFVPGSDDDVANLELGLAVREAGLATCVPSEGLIASGGVDLFLAGVERSAVDGAQVGVHSWSSGDGTDGSELPEDHPDHQLYLDYYADIGVDEAFYWFTLEAAPPEGIHWMTREEIGRYGLETSATRRSRHEDPPRTPRSRGGRGLDR